MWKICLVVFAVFMVACGSEDGTKTGTVAAANGSDGTDGESGRDGQIGAPGTPGTQGPKGDPGAVGTPGPVGPKGESGTGVGVPGPQGPAGSAGAMGPKGDQGAAGIQGMPGLQGPMGPQGLAGPSGASLSKTNLYRVVSATVSVPANAFVQHTATCDDTNDIIVSGGCFVQGAVSLNPASSVTLSQPSMAVDVGVKSGWSCGIAGSSSQASNLTVTAICMSVP